MRPYHYQGCFTTGTDTGVGKTVITAALALCLKHRGIRVAAMKPIETGCSNEKDLGSDAERLRTALAATTSIDLICPYRFSLPLAPLAAARAAGAAIEIDRIAATFYKLADEQDFVLVEGAGGLLVPISEETDIRDLIAQLKLPVVVVGRPALGGVNHALLTVEALRQRDIPVIGIVLNQQVQELHRKQIESTVDLIRERSGVPVFGPIPFESKCQDDWIAGVRNLAQDPAIHSLAERLAPSSR